MRWYRLLPLCLLPALAGAQQLTFATYQGGSGNEATAGTAQDSAGNLFLAGATDSADFPSTSTAGGGFVVKLDSAGKRLAAILIPGVALTAIAIDAADNVVAAGNMGVAGALTPSAGAYSTPKGTGFVLKLSNKLDKISWTSTFSATPAALAIDATKNIYVTGTATSTFVTTTGAVQPAIHGTSDAFVLKLSADGSTAMYATFLGGSQEDAGYAIAVDSNNLAYVTGATGSSDFPLVAAAQSKFGGRLFTISTGWYGDAFVSKLDANGATLLYSTYLGGAAADQGNAITVDGSGNAYVAGGTESTGLATAGAFQTKYGGPDPDPKSPYPSGDAFVAKLSASGSLTWFTYLGGGTYDGASAVALDRAGNIWVAGNTDSDNFPKAGTQVPDCHVRPGGAFVGHPFLAELDANGAKLQLTTGTSGIGFDQVFGMAFDAAHNIAYLAGESASLVFFATPGAAQTSYGGGDADAFVARIDLTLQPSMSVSCVLNAASFLAGNTAPFPTGAVAPGEIVSLFGVGLGPAAPLTLQLAADGSVAKTLGGSQVLFDGVAAPMLYVASGQINAVVPYGVKGPTTAVTVQSGAKTFGPFVLPVATAVPAIFTYDGTGIGQAAVLNSDYTYNTVANPAVRGDYVTFYACGAGLMSSSIDGAVTPGNPPWATPNLSVSVSIRGVKAQVQYGGAAPNYVSGLLQVNVYVPSTVDFGDHLPLLLTIGTFTSQFEISIAAK